MRKEINEILGKVEDEKLSFGEAANKLLNLFSVNHSALLNDLKVTNALYEERQKLLDAIPECKAHDKCVPHALEWIAKAKQHCG